MVKEPVDHILRPLLPWRPTEGGVTECGFDAAKVKVISRSEYTQRLKDLGRQRASLFTCMTCADTSSRWGAWPDDPRQALEREIAWERGNGYLARTDRGQRLKDELLAIASLIENHREEFEQHVEAVALRRDWLERKANRPQRKPGGAL